MPQKMQKIYAALREQVSDQTLVDRLVRAVRQQTTQAHIDALRKHVDPTVEALAGHLQEALSTGLKRKFRSRSFDPSTFVKEHEETLELIAREAAHSFQELAEK